MTIRPLSRRVLGSVGVIIVVFGAAVSPTWSSGDEPERVRNAKRVLQDEAKAILFFAHPTVDFNEATYDGYDSLDDGFVVKYTYRWTSAFGNDGRTSLAFYYGSSGELDFLKSRSCTAFVPCFSAANVVIKFIKEEIEKDPDLRNDRKLIRLLEKGDARALLEWYLKQKAH